MQKTQTGWSELVDESDVMQIVQLYTCNIRPGNKDLLKLHGRLARKHN
jgi:hypothetical protein